MPRGAARALLGSWAALWIAGCGNTGDLYLPGSGADREVVTRSGPAPDASGTANSPQTADGPALPPTPAPEVTQPEPAPDEEQEKTAEPR